MITEIRIGCARTINLGNYESLRIEAGVTKTIEDAADMENARAQAESELRKLMEETYRAQYRSRATESTEGKSA